MCGKRTRETYVALQGMSALNQDDAIPMRVLEETPPRSVTAVDVEENGQIDYLITYGNKDGLFNMSHTADNRGLLRVAKRVDREAAVQLLLTIKCFPAHTSPSSLRKAFYPQDPSEIQVRVTVDDIDDNLPLFKQDNLMTIGFPLNLQVDTALVTLEAVDADADAPGVKYSLLGAEFHRSGVGDMGVPADTPIFSLNKKTGELRTAAPFGDGMFTLVIAANNDNEEARASNTTVKDESKS